MKRVFLVILLANGTLFVGGCTNQAWYEVLREQQRQVCRQQGPSETQQCLERVNGISYQQYERLRSESLKRD